MNRKMLNEAYIKALLMLIKVRMDYRKNFGGK